MSKLCENFKKRRTTFRITFNFYHGTKFLCHQFAFPNYCRLNLKESFWWMENTISEINYEPLDNTRAFPALF